MGCLQCTHRTASTTALEITMNTPQITTRLASRLVALAFSTVFTLAMLVSVDQLATTDAPALQMARITAPSQG
jgi:hypothetical protein